jgi:hypothetical protein
LTTALQGRAQQTLFGFRRVVFLDTEFGIAPDETPLPICMVIRTLPDRQLHRLWLLGAKRLPYLPFALRDPTSVWIAYNIPAEVSVLLKLEAPLPHHWIDFFAEYRAATNGHRHTDERTRLVEALAHYGEFAIDAEEKEQWQDMAKRHDVAELEANKEGMLDYCQSDTDALVTLFDNPRLQADLAKFHPQEMLFRGRSMVARARVIGPPVDTPLLEKITRHRAAAWLAVTRQGEERHHWGIFDDSGIWNQSNYESWLKRLDIRLPRTKKSGKATTKTEVLERYEIKHPALTPLRQTIGLRRLLQNFRVPANAAGRSVWFANPFGSITGRDQPSSAQNLFGLPKMFRQLIRPAKGYSLAYIDISAEEVWIGSRLSNCAALERAYRGDIYVQALIAVGRLPPGATAESHPHERRKRGKPFILGVGYGQTAHGLAPRLEILHDAAAELIWRHRYRSFPEFNQFQRSIVGAAERRSKTYFTKLGWPYWTGNLRSARSMLNFPMQSGGSDYMRVVLIAATEAAIRVCCCVHDGFLIEAPTLELEDAIDMMMVICKAAGEALFGSAPMVQCEQRIHWPNRFDPSLSLDERATWKLILQVVDNLEAGGSIGAANYA